MERFIRTLHTILDLTDQLDSSLAGTAAETLGKTLPKRSKHPDYSGITAGFRTEVTRAAPSAAGPWKICILVKVLPLFSRTIGSSCYRNSSPIFGSG